MSANYTEILNYINNLSWFLSRGKFIATKVSYIIEIDVYIMLFHDLLDITRVQLFNYLPYQYITSISNRHYMDTFIFK